MSGISGLIIKKEKQPKQPLDVNDSVPYAQTIPPSSYNNSSGYPGNTQYDQAVQ